MAVTHDDDGCQQEWRREAGTGGSEPRKDFDPSEWHGNDGRIYCYVLLQVRRDGGGARQPPGGSNADAPAPGVELLPGPRQCEPSRLGQARQRNVPALKSCRGHLFALERVRGPEAGSRPSAQILARGLVGLRRDVIGRVVAIAAQ